MEETMRKLLVLRGAPGAGKTTWLNENRLMSYTLSFDHIWSMYHSPVQTIYGKMAALNKISPEVNDTLFAILERRMEQGEFTIIDGINSKRTMIQKFEEMAQKYRYKLYVIDFTTVPIEEAKFWNLNRIGTKRVREKIIDSVYEDFEKEDIPKRITVIHPDNIEQVFEKTADLSSYKKIHHIGDIHACYDTFHKALVENGNLRSDEFYIFLGDYTDKGKKNHEMLEFLLSIRDAPNVVLCEGNHEKWIWNWCNEVHSYPDEFRKYTLPQIDSLEKKDVRKCYQGLKEVYIYEYKGKKVLNTHGGLATIPHRIDFVSAYQLIHGVGFYSDLKIITNVFATSTSPETYQVLGHRNPESLPMNSGSRTFYLEDCIYAGGTLRWLTLDKNGFQEKSYRNVAIRE